MLTGTADDVGMASVFKLLATARRTGRLSVVRPAGSATVFFDRGRIYHAHSDLLPASLGERLVASGALGAEELRRAKDRSATTGRSLEEVLQTGSGVDPTALQTALRAQLKDAAADVLSWEVGEFSWETGRVMAADVWIDLDVGELLALTVDALEAPVHAASPPPPPPPSARSATGALMTRVAPPAAPPELDEVSLDSAPIGGIEDDAQLPSQPEIAGGRGLRLAPEPAAAPQRTFAIAFICTGNRFRSPITEALVRARAMDVDVATASVGRHDARPGPALPEAMEVARDMGLDLSEHRARPLIPRELRGFDLVLGFERSHVAEAVRLGGAPRDRAFTLMEFVDLLGEIGPVRSEDPLERARLVVRRAHDHRRLVRKHGAAVDLVDPIGQTIGAYRNSAAQIVRLADRLVAGLFGTQVEETTSPTPFWRGA